MPLEILTIPCRSDNYAFLAHSADPGETFLVDAPEAGPILAVLKEKGWSLGTILLTHHHPDHVEGLPGLLAEHDAQVVGAAADAHRLGSHARGYRQPPASRSLGAAPRCLARPMAAGPGDRSRSSGFASPS